MQLEHRRIDIAFLGDVGAARNTAKMMALGVGFPSETSEEIALVVSELASNLIKHAKCGEIMLQPFSEGGRVGIQIESHDKGPGIRNVEEALTDGYSTAGSLGFGLGTVNRMMDEFHIASENRPPNNGTHITCKRFVRADALSSMPAPLDFGVATRPHPLMNVNGDAFIIKQWGTSALIGVIDGLGHGQYALRAAQTARQFVETHYDQPLSSIFLGVGRVCRATRGVVMSLARFDWTPDLSRIILTFSGIGNVEMHVIGKHESMNFIIRRGILGVNAPNPVVTEHLWNPEYVMVLHSDGISSHWKWIDFPEMEKVSPDIAAQRLLKHSARDEDDATVIIVKGKNRKNERQESRA